MNSLFMFIFILVILVIFDNLMSEVSSEWDDAMGDAASYVVRGIIVLWLATILAFVPEWLKYIAGGLLCLPVVYMVFFLLGKKAEKEREKELEMEGRNLQARMAGRR